MAGALKKKEATRASIFLRAANAYFDIVTM